MARRTKLTQEVEERIIKALLAGSYIGVAAQCAGVHPATFYRWMERGDPAGSRAADRPYRVFRARVEQTLAEAEVRQLALLDRAGETHWRARAWLLERRHPGRWGRRAASRPDEAPASSRGGDSESRPPSVSLTGLSDEQLAALASAVGVVNPSEPRQDVREEEHAYWLALAQTVWFELYHRAVPLGCELHRDLISAELELIRQNAAGERQGGPFDEPDLQAQRDEVAARHGLPPRPR